MSILNTGIYYELYCDICGEAAEDYFDTFFDAVEFKRDKENGWRSKKEAGDWNDYCPECCKEGQDD